MKTLSKKEYEKLLRYTRYRIGKITNIEAEDILHEVAFKVFSKVDFESSVENLVAYLYRSVKNKIAEMNRKPKRTVSWYSFTDANMSDALSEALKNECKNFDTESTKKELRERLHRAVQLLPHLYRDVIIATAFEGKTIRELSKEWDTPMGTLLSRRHRALARLHDILKSDFVEL
ncbi:MAG: RNA polymerase sigma factor [Cytophagales bacterium]|nr:RNA polymerase sigma factor [Cytophagales bacterium]